MYNFSTLLVVTVMAAYALFWLWTITNPLGALHLISRLLHWKQQRREKRIANFVQKSTDDYYNGLKKFWLKRGYKLKDFNQHKQNSRNKTEQMYRQIYHQIYDDQPSDAENFFNL